MIIFVCPQILIAQSDTDPNKKTVEDAIENSAEEINETGQTEFPEELISLINNPLDLNKDNLEIFITYNLITQVQLNALEDYKLKSGKHRNRSLLIIGRINGPICCVRIRITSGLKPRSIMIAGFVSRFMNVSRGISLFVN